MSKCKACGAEIKWIKTVGGKAMPCNAKSLYYSLDRGGTEKIVTADGRVLSAYEVFDPERSDGIGYRPHCASCPAAGKFRK